MEHEIVLKEIHDQSLQEIETEVAGKPKLKALWEKVGPLVRLLGTIFGRKVRPYINAFVAAIDELVAQEED